MQLSEIILNEVKESRERLSVFRSKRNRCRDYTYGRQWNDMIEVDGQRITEYEYIIREGNVPLKNNLIRRIVRNVLGIFRENLQEVMKECYGDELRTIAENNSLEELYTRSMEEFLISGMAVHRKRICCGSDKAGILTEAVSPDNFFFNSYSKDPRGSDLSLAGQIHRVSLNDWCKAFVKTRGDYEKAVTIFDYGRKQLKVTEVWRKEMVPGFITHDRAKGMIRRVKMNEGVKDMPKKWALEEMWRYYFITDDGHILAEGDSPYCDASNPYIVKCYPFIDGEIQSFVGDMIDQQRYTNRLITLYDWVIRASAKGVLMIPESAVTPGRLREFADQWSRFNGVIVYKPKAGDPEPKQINGNMGNLGIGQLLEIQLKMMEDVSGVNGVLQGNTSGGNVSGELYNSQTTNALYSLKDILETFYTFIRTCAVKDRNLLNQSLGKYSYFQ